METNYGIKIYNLVFRNWIKKNESCHLRTAVVVAITEVQYVVLLGLGVAKKIRAESCKT